jgi:hypothetical protein
MPSAAPWGADLFYRKLLSAGSLTPDAMPGTLAPAVQDEECAARVGRLRGGTR